MHTALFRHISTPLLGLALLGTVSFSPLVTESHADFVTEAQLNDYTEQVKITVSDIEYNRRIGRYYGVLKIHSGKTHGSKGHHGGFFSHLNHSPKLDQNNSVDIDGTLVIILNELPSGVTPLNADGVISGNPYILVPGGLPAGKTIFVPVSFKASPRTNITFTPSLHQLINGKVEAAAVRALSAPFTIAAIPDTQIYAEENDPGFAAQIDWILDNAASKNLVFATHLGDVVDNGTDTVQWTNSMDALEPLLAQEELPFSIVRGNHDDPTFFLANLPVSEMAKKSWFVAADPSGLTQAQVFRVEDACFLHIGFQKDPTGQELAWANDLLARPELQGLPVIVSTHDYIDGSGQSATGRIIWEQFVKDNPMVFMVLNGHTHTEYALVNHNEANRPVYQMLSDYQDRANAGNGLMRLVTIDPIHSKILVKTFSPYYNQQTAEYFETDADSQFEYDVNIKERLAFDTNFDFGSEPPPPPLPELEPIPTAVSYTHIFQNRRPLVGTATPYAGTVDVQINENNANLNYGGEATLTTDMDDNGSRVHAFLRFDDIIGTNPGQIPPGATITSAKLVFHATSSTKGMVRMHRMLKNWGEHTAWMDFTPVNSSGQPDWEAITYLNTDTGIYNLITLPNVMVGGGVQANDIEAMAETDATFTMPKPIPLPFILEPAGYGTAYPPTGTKQPTSGLPLPAQQNLEVDLTKAVQAWANGATNYGWFFEPTASDGWDFETAEGKQPPALVVEVAGAPLVQ